MLIIERGLGPRLPDESQFTWYSYDPSEEKPEYDPVESVTVHPWHRYQDTRRESRMVAVTVRCGADEELGSYEIIIADRAEFVAGLLAVFPELRRAESEHG